MTEQELTDLNLQVAAIAGWTDIQEWQPERSLPIKTYQGVNLAHPELGRFVPNYVEDLNAIVKVFDLFRIEWQLVNLEGYSDAALIDCKDVSGFCCSLEVSDVSPAIALCKLLIAINPEPIKPESEVAVIDDDGDIDEPTVIEATFG